MKSSVVLIPGAGGAGWIWRFVEAELRGLGFDAFAVDLPAADEAKGLPAYAAVVVSAIGRRRDVAIVALSLGGFTAALVSQLVPVRNLIFVNAMVPQPGETAGAWWGNVGSEAARIAAAERGGYSSEFDLDTYFLHDLPAALAEQVRAGGEPESSAAFDDACEFAWPDVRLDVIAGRDDRFFPLDLQQRVARDRLGVAAHVVPGGHLAPLSHPRELSSCIAEILEGELAADSG
jgi:pimeloyl-ACP methyl ester carboxylesterase